jgi:hypothetical protein
MYSLKVPLNYYDPGKPCLFQPPGIYHYHCQVVLRSQRHCSPLPPPIWTHVSSSSKKNCRYNCMHNYRLLFIADIHFRLRPRWTSSQLVVIVLLNSIRLSDRNTSKTITCFTKWMRTSTISSSYNQFRERYLHVEGKPSN